VLTRLIILLSLLVFFALPVWATEDPTYFQEEKKKAEAGDAEAQRHLGQMYEWGIYGVKQDRAESMKWFRKAAEQGNARAQGHLGFAYFVGDAFSEGLGVKRDEVEAFKWYHMAAEQGDAGDQRQIGNMYFEGWGVKKDDAEGVKWLRKAADQGYWLAQQEAGELYAKGEKVKQDYAEAYYWYSLCDAKNDTAKHLTPEQKAAADKRVAEWEKMHPAPAAAPPVYGPPAPVTEIEIIEARLAHTNEDYRTAVRLFRLLAERGSGEAQLQLGELYRYGQGVKKDDEEASKWLHRAFQTLRPLAEQGDWHAQGELGEMYEKGEGVKQDYAEALFWYDVGNCECELPKGALTSEQEAAVDKRAAAWKLAHPAPATAEKE